MFKLLHRIKHGHWPFYKYLGYDKYKFDQYGDDCLRCI